MSKLKPGTLCTGPVYIFDCEAVDYEATVQTERQKKSKVKERESNRPASQRPRKITRKSRP